MGSFNIICLLLIFITNFILLMQTGLSDDITSPPIGSPTQRPSSSYQKHLTICIRKLSIHCIDEIFGNALFANHTVSDTCCVSLERDMGQKCHEDIMRSLLPTLGLTKADRIRIWERSKNIWNDCVARLLLDIISPSEAPNYF